MRSQNSEVLAHLQAGNRITNAQAFTHMRITRLSARIHDLRRLGYDIQGEVIKRRSKRTGRVIRYLAYYLPQTRRSRRDDYSWCKHNTAK